MEFREALFKIVEEAIKRSEEGNWDGFIETVFGILEQVDDKKAVIEFLTKQSDSDAVTNLGEPYVWVIDCLAKVAKEVVGIVEKPQEPEKTEESERHGSDEGST